jgi:hypothetical protein
MNRLVLKSTFIKIRNQNYALKTVSLFKTTAHTIMGIEYDDTRYTMLAAKKSSLPRDFIHQGDLKTMDHHV